MLGHCRQYGDLRLLEVMEERNGPSGLRDDDDDDDILLELLHTRCAVLCLMHLGVVCHILFTEYWNFGVYKLRG